MITYVLMKILESSPSRYDRGIRILTLGEVDKTYDHIVSHIKKGQKVLDIGCGTGALTLKAAEKGAKVKGIDINPQMLEIARKKAVETGLLQNIKLQERGVAELESEKTGSYDVVTAVLCFSELNENELEYTIREVKRILRPGGALLVADEVISKNILKMILNWLIKLPLAVVTYIIAQTTTHAVKNLPEKIKEAGLQIETVKLNRMENFIELMARKDRGDSK